MASTYHSVKQGECLSSIARLYGFSSFEVIYSHPNNSEFKSRRPNPNTLKPGDRVFICDKDTKAIPAETNKSHKFVATTAKVALRLAVKDGDGQPYANTHYQIQFDDVESDGTTDGEGRIEVKVPPDAAQGTLILFQGATGQDVLASISLDLGCLDPIDEVTGIQSRLNNLGFHCGVVDGVCGEHTKSALRAFQESNGLTVTGEADPDTRNKLRQQHDWL